MNEVRQRLGAGGTLVQIRSLSSEGIRRNDCLGMKAVAADWTAWLDLTQSRHNASSWHPERKKGISMPLFFRESDYIALVQHFLAAYFLASKARRASAIPRDLVVDAD